MHKRDWLPPEITQGQPRLVITGRDEVLLEGHEGLFSYETGNIRVRTGAGMLQVMGENLTIDYFGVQDMLIRGRVDGVQYGGDGA
ncbi:MAG: YabP/YqfC family sporulation protein [Clostridia bacterium]|nr:YabP/YqfC family sporulation protein [Clostridia bacterium]